MSGFFREVWEFLVDVFGSLMRDALKLLVAFGIGTGASAVVCWYYGLPLALSLVGGFIVLGVVVALLAGSSFF